MLVGSDYWRGLLDWVQAAPLSEGKISPEDVDLYTVTDEPGEVLTRDAVGRASPGAKSGIGIAS